MDFIGYIETVYDSFILAEAARRGHVKMLSRRPNLALRSQVYSGKTIVFEENNTGIKRWTDGKSWSPSKLSNGFFIYYETPKTDISNIKSLLCDNSEKLVKKVITVITPNLSEIHIINYFHESEKITMHKPSTYLFPDIELIKKEAMEFSYIRCYRSRSKSWRKLCKLQPDERGGINNISDSTLSLNALSISPIDEFISIYQPIDSTLNNKKTTFNYTLPPFPSIFPSAFDHNMFS